MANRHEPKHWRDIAEEARVMAESFHEPTARLAMLEIADRCERIARRRERRSESTSGADTLLRAR